MQQGHTSRRLARGVAGAAALGLLATGLGVSAGAGPATAAPRDKPVKSDIRSVGGDYNDGKPLPFSKEGAGGSGVNSDQFKVGTVRKWPALDDAQGTVYSKQFVLRGVGDNVEVWVAKDLAFPAGSSGACRNTVGGGEGIVVTDEQVASFIDEFDGNIYPKESEAFSVPPSRDGSVTPLTRAYAQFYKLPARTFKGDGDRIVTLVDNVRDQNYYDPTAADGKTYIAGFFWSLINNYTNRNVMTLDSWDWIHRTGATPPDDSGDEDYEACSEAIQRPFGDARPYTYEGTFAHEYQHLLEYYESPGESSWVNEGLSDWAQTLVGYVDPSIDPSSDDPDADSHIQTWLGWFLDDESFGGPEQSLTQWEDQGAPEILADYGIAYSFMEYLWSHFGEDEFMSALHKQDLNGFAGLDATLDEFDYDVTSQQVLHDFLASMAVDKQLDTKGLVGGTDAREAALKTSSMNASINWDTPQANSSPGAPNNGADYVALGTGGTVAFDGAEIYPTTPIAWKQDGARLFSDAGDNLDNGIARQLTVPATGDQTVTLGLEWDTEPAWDFAFVQVFDDASGTWKSLSNADTTSAADPDADPKVVANLPGFTGASGGVRQETFDLSGYAGKTVWLGVRYITDGAVTNPGVWLSSLTAFGSPVAGATDLSTWKSYSEAKPTPVAGWTVQLVGWDATQVSVVSLPLGAGSTWSGDAATLLGIASPEFVGAIVTADDPTEQASDYPTYSLTLDGAQKADGGPAAG